MAWHDKTARYTLNCFHYKSVDCFSCISQLPEVSLMWNFECGFMISLPASAIIALIWKWRNATGDLTFMFPIIANDNLSNQECIINKLNYGYFTCALMWLSTLGNFRSWQIQTAYIPFNLNVRRLWLQW